MERLALQEKDVIMEAVLVKIDNENTRSLRNKTIRIGWDDKDLTSMLCVRLRDKPQLTLLTERKTLKYVQRLYREVSFLVDLRVRKNIAMKTFSE